MGENVAERGPLITAGSH